MTTRYETALALLNKRPTKKLSHNTYASFDTVHEVVRIRFHDTVIIVVRPDSSIVLNSDNFRTKTTKERFEWLLPKLGTRLRLQSNKGMWWLSTGWVYNPPPDQAVYAFKDGLTILPDDSVQGAMTDKEVKEQLKLAKDIKQYAKDYIKALFVDRTVPAPSNGDCWACLFRDTKTGEAALGSDHLLSHMSKDARYYVPSLLTLAEHSFPLSDHAKGLVAMLWYHPEKLGTPGYRHGMELGDFGPQQIRKCIENYMRHQFGLSARGMKRPDGSTRGF